jgi:purine-binding chemotaxis protein CheW
MANVVQEGQQARTAELLQLVSFNLNGEEYGVDILRVQEINRMLQITKVPQAPSFVEGVINLRGKVIPIISLRKRFGFEDRAHDKKTRIVVVDIGGRVIQWQLLAIIATLLTAPHQELTSTPRCPTIITAT